jgi:methionyl aminopeptidase
MAIELKTLDQLKTMRRAGSLVGETLQLLRETIKPGMTTSALDAVAAANIKRGGGKPNFLGYHGYPATICVSVNEEIVHGIPGDRVIHEGDVVSIDCGAIIDGWHGDAAFTVVVGAGDSEESEDVGYLRRINVARNRCWQERWKAF